MVELNQDNAENVTDLYNQSGDGRSTDPPTHESRQHSAASSRTSSRLSSAVSSVYEDDEDPPTSARSERRRKTKRKKPKLSVIDEHALLSDNDKEKASAEKQKRVIAEIVGGEWNKVPHLEPVTIDKSVKEKSNRNYSKRVDNKQRESLPEVKLQKEYKVHSKKRSDNNDKRLVPLKPKPNLALYGKTVNGEHKVDQDLEQKDTHHEKLGVNTLNHNESNNTHRSQDSQRSTEQELNAPTSGIPSKKLPVISLSEIEKRINRLSHNYNLPHNDTADDKQDTKRVSVISAPPLRSLLLESELDQYMRRLHTVKNRTNYFSNSLNPTGLSKSRSTGPINRPHTALRFTISERQRTRFGSDMLSKTYTDNTERANIRNIEKQQQRTYDLQERMKTVLKDGILKRV